MLPPPRFLPAIVADSKPDARTSRHANWPPPAACVARGERGEKRTGEQENARKNPPRGNDPCQSGERKAESGVGFPSQTGGRTFLSALCRINSDRLPQRRRGAEKTAIDVVSHLRDSTSPRAIFLPVQARRQPRQDKPRNRRKECGKTVCRGQCRGIDPNRLAQERRGAERRKEKRDERRVREKRFFLLARSAFVVIVVPAGPRFTAIASLVRRLAPSPSWNAVARICRRAASPSAAGQFAGIGSPHGLGMRFHPIG